MKLNLITISLISVCIFTGAVSFAQTNPTNSMINKVKVKLNQTPPDEQFMDEDLPPPPTKDESTLALIRPNAVSSMAARPTEILPPAPSPDEEEKPVRGIPINTVRDTTPVSTGPAPAEQQPPAPMPKKVNVIQEKTPKKEFKRTPPPEKNDGIKWRTATSGNFEIKMEPRKQGIATPNLAMKFETIHQILRRNISWMMGGKTNVTVYAARESFLKNEHMAGDWAGAFFSPTDNRIVMYDEPNNIDKMIELFSHELTHLFFDGFFNPKERSAKVEPPIWVNEGLAVNMEDIAMNQKGGAWADDLIYLNILSQGDREALQSMAKSGQRLGSKQKTIIKVPRNTVFFTNFGEFVKDSSYDRAVANNDVENWYRQAYAMVRFLFKPYNSTYPEKRMQFEQFTKELSRFSPKIGPDGKPVKNSKGETLMVKTSTETALRKAYGFRDMKDFETRFWSWLKELRKKERESRGF